MLYYPIAVRKSEGEVKENTYFILILLAPGWLNTNRKRAKEQFSHYGVHHMLKCDALWQNFLTKQHYHTAYTDTWIEEDPESLSREAICLTWFGHLICKANIFNHENISCLV